MARYTPGPRLAKIDSLIGYWPFFRSANDNSGNGNNGVVSNADLINGRTGIDNAAYEFNGSDSIITIPSASIFNVSNVSILGWAYVDSSSGESEFLSKEFQPSAPYHDYALQFQQGAVGRIRFRINIGGSAISLLYDDSSLLDAWHMYGATFDGSTMRIFVDGVQVSSKSQSGSIESNDASITIGDNPRNGDPLTGLASEIFLFSEGLPSASILALYNQFVVNRGSMGGNVFQKSGASFAIRHRRKPRLQKTPRTTQSRVNFNYIQSNWRELSGANQASWATQIPNFQRVNSLGQTYSLDSTQLFASQNKIRADFQLPIEPAAVSPVVFPDPGIDSVLLFPSVPEAFVNILPVEVPSGFVYNVFLSNVLLSPPSSPSIQTFFLMASFDEGSDSDIFFSDRWASQFGVSASDIGSYQVFKLEIFHRATGQRIIDSIVVTELLS